MPYLHWETEWRRARLEKVMRNITPANEPRTFDSMIKVVEAAVSHAASKSLKDHMLPHQIIGRTKLGEVLYQAAMLFEAMDTYIEEQIMRDDLYGHPPFHPRRTLAQSNFWSLNAPKDSNEQLVYRETKPKREVPCYIKCECKHCRNSARMVPRVVMIDQLWLWVLDGSMCVSFLHFDFFLLRSTSRKDWLSLQAYRVKLT